MAAFDPDKYLEEKKQKGEEPSKGFNPDAYLAEKEQVNPSEVSTTGAFLRQAQQPLTLNFGDEITAAQDTLLKGAGVPMPEEEGLAKHLVRGLSIPFAGPLAAEALIKNPLAKLLEQYKQNQVSQQDLLKQGKEQHPVASGMGEAAGIIAPLVLSGGAAAPALGMEIPAQQTFREILKQGGRGALAKEVGKTAAEGGLMTGAAEIGRAEESALGSNQDREKLAEKGLVGTVGGALVAPAFRGGLEQLMGGKPAPIVQDTIENAQSPSSNPMIGRAKSLYERGKQGELITTAQKMQEQEAGKIEQYSKQVVDLLNKAEKPLMQEKQALLETAQQARMNVDVNPRALSAAEIVSTVGRADDNIPAELHSLIEIYKEQGLNPKNAETLRKGLKSIGYKIKEPVLKDSVASLEQEVTREMERTMPGLQDLNEQISGILSMGKETLLGGGKLPRVPAKQEKVLIKEVGKLIQKAREGGPGSQEAVLKLQQLTQNLRKLEEIPIPETGGNLLEKTGINPDQIKNYIMSKGDEVLASQKLRGLKPTVPGLQVLGTKLPGEATALRAANVAGFLAGKAGKAPGKLAEFSRNLYAAPDAILVEGAKMLEDHSSPNIKSLGTSLIQSIENKDNQKKNAVLFSIAQRPEARKALGLDTTESDETWGRSR